MICCIYFYVFDKILKADFHNLIPGTGCNCQLADLFYAANSASAVIWGLQFHLFLAEGAAHLLA